MAKKDDKVDVGITVKKDEDFSEWYTQLLQKAELVDIRYGIKGFTVYRHWATKSMKKMYRDMEEILESKDHEPIVLPTLIPEKNFYLEATHVEGFTPEVFWVTETGAGQKIEEKLALRPTSETAFYQMYSLWIRSHRDLPFKRYQSCSVFRCESKATRPLFRAREFHWIEAHNAFATMEDAEKQVLEDMESTKEFLLDKLAMPFIFFERPAWDTFPGAVHTYAADVLMPSGKVIQLPSTHLLGTNFSKPFNVTYKDENGKETFAYLTCYGPAISRIYGAMICLHGDDKGLVLPFEVAPLQIVIVPIIFKDETKEMILEKCHALKDKLKHYTVKVDDRDEYKPGYKFNHWEMKGVPIRIEIGPRDMEKKQVVIARRDTGEKMTVPESKLRDEVDRIALRYTQDMVARTQEMFKDNIINAHDIDEVKKVIDDEKIARVNFCSCDKDGETCAEAIEKEVVAQVRGTIVGKTEEVSGKCVVCGEEAKAVVYIAKSY